MRITWVCPLSYLHSLTALHPQAVPHSAQHNNAVAAAADHAVLQRGQAIDHRVVAVEHARAAAWKVILPPHDGCLAQVIHVALARQRGTGHQSIESRILLLRVDIGAYHDVCIREHTRSGGECEAVYLWLTACLNTVKGFLCWFLGHRAHLNHQIPGQAHLSAIPPISGVAPTWDHRCHCCRKTKERSRSSRYDLLETAHTAHCMK